MEPLLQVKNLTKNFGAVCVLKDLSIEVEPGEIFGVLGLNGIGKTTMFKCILGLISRNSGEILYRGQELDQQLIHQKIGYLPEFYLPPGELTGHEYLRLLSLAISGNRPDIDNLFRKTDLDSRKPIKDYSRGMIQRLGLAISLLKSPEFIILDEPTLGLDPLARQNLLEWLKELNRGGQTIMLSSHDFSQVEKLCQRVAIVHDRQIKYTGKIDDFTAKHQTSSLEEAFLKEIGGLHA
ncbi:MAG: ABC transporter ATP-binding protein [Candidatus Riflebacteria bacterium]